MSTRKANLERILTMVPMIAANPGMTVAELARRFECSKPEIHADLARILLCGVPPYLPNDFLLVDIEGDRVYIDFAERFARPVSLLVEEALALRLALDDLRTLVSGRAEEVVRGLARKVDRVLGERDERAQQAVERVDGLLARSEQALAQQLTTHVLEKRPIEIEYYTAARDVVSRRIVWPRAIEEKEGALYLRAHCARRGDERSFRIERIRSIESNAEVMRRAEQLDNDAAREPEPPNQELVLSFDPGIARYVEERYSGVERDPETGRAILHLQTRHLEWVFAWLLPFGGQAELVSPPEARQRYAARLDRILARHAE